MSALGCRLRLLMSVIGALADCRLLAPDSALLPFVGDSFTPFEFAYRLPSVGLEGVTLRLATELKRFGKAN